jgi:hypothetical protein
MPCTVLYTVYVRSCVRRIARRTDFKKRPTDKTYPEKRVFDNRKNVFLVVCVSKPTDFKLQLQPIETHAETPTETADLSKLTIQDRMAVSVRVVGVALLIKFNEVKGETEMALEGASGAAAEAHVVGSGYEATAAALGTAIRALSTSTGPASCTLARSPASARARASAPRVSASKNFAFGS